MFSAGVQFVDAEKRDVEGSGTKPLYPRGNGRVLLTSTAP